LTDDGSAPTWYLGDALGSVCMTLDGAGAVLGTVGYDPWGYTPGRSVGDVRVCRRAAGRYERLALSAGAVV
ncbi:MAG: hypothetical protein MI924_37150, partial [Chloroflexales bacterium]|nr:hypothetical protein [Chloroflexales bacterium]